MHCHTETVRPIGIVERPAKVRGRANCRDVHHRCRCFVVTWVVERGIWAWYIVVVVVVRVAIDDRRCVRPMLSVATMWSVIMYRPFEIVDPVYP